MPQTLVYRHHAIPVDGHFCVHTRRPAEAAETWLADAGRRVLLPVGADRDPTRPQLRAPTKGEGAGDDGAR